MEEALILLKKKTVKLLSYRPRSVSEIKLRLKKLKYATPALIDQVIDYFLNADLLNDQKFATWWVDQRTTHRPKGNIALKYELYQKGIDRDIIQSVLLSPDKEVFLVKKLLKKHKITKKQKAFSKLKSKGFTPNSIYRAIDEQALGE